MRALVYVLFVASSCAVSVAQGSSTGSCSAMSLGTNGALNGFVPSPNDAWHQDISSAPVDPNSNRYVTAAVNLNNAKLHPDFSSISGGAAGIPYVVVDSSQTPGVSVSETVYADESDITIAPVPANAPIEGFPGSCPTDGSDRHMLVLDRNGCVDYEFYQAAACNGSYTASNTALWDMTITEQRPYLYTSVDAAGLSVFEGLLRYDEIVAGEVNHAIRFTAQHTKTGNQGSYFVAPATHGAGDLYGTDNIIGMRIRLKASFDISGFSATNQIILKGLKKYGMILADNGSNMYFQGTPDSRWDDDDLNQLKTLTAASFEVVQLGTVYNRTTVPTGSAPVISSFTASPTTVAAGAPVVLTPVVSNASYSYIDQAGYVRDSATVYPTATTSYVLTSRNAYGTVSSSAVTVTVVSGTAPSLSVTPVPDKTYGAAPFNVSAASNSPGTITFSIASGPATLSGSTVTLTGAGTVTVQASQAASGTYAAATATTSFVVNAAGSLSVISVTGFASPATVGVPSRVTVQAQDTNGNVITGFTGTVALTSSDPAATLPSAYTFTSSDAGAHPFSVMLNTVGTHSITASSGSVNGAQSAIAVGGAIWLLNAPGSLAIVSNSGGLIA